MDVEGRFESILCLGHIVKLVDQNVGECGTRIGGRSGKLPDVPAQTIVRARLVVL